MALFAIGAPVARRRRRGPDPELPTWAPLLPTLDLHGETAESARRRALRWLEEQRSSGAGTVRIVTGRGTRSLGPPVLPGEIGDLLRALRGRSIAGFVQESGGGAYRVELLSPRLPGARGPPRDPRLDDPGRRRLAMRALEELGVTPTPPVIDAEILRSLREADDR